MEWKLYSLEMDNDGRDIGVYFASHGYEIERVKPIEGRESLLCVHPKTIENIISESVITDNKVLALSSHGKYHHLTYGFCKKADKLSKRYGYIHIDHHDDLFGHYRLDFDFNSPIIHCGRFVRTLCADTNVGKKRSRPDVLFIGSKPTLLYCLQTLHAKRFLFTGFVPGFFSEMFCTLDRLLDMLPDDVYISIDLDVTAPCEVRTAFTRGNMAPANLYRILWKIKNAKNIIGADIIGYTTSNLPYSSYDDRFGLVGGLRDEEEPCFEQSMAVYKNLVDLLLEEK